MPGISFDRAAPFYDDTRGFPAGVDVQVRDAIVGLAGASPTTRFVELGVGTGRVALPFVRAGYHYTGIDLSRAMMLQLRRKIAGDPARATYRLQLCQGDVMYLPFGDRVFDVAIITHVLHLVDDWRQVLDEARRVLHQRGQLLLAYNEDARHGPDGAPTPVQRAWQRWGQILADLGVERAQRGGSHSVTEEAAEYLRERGAQVEQVTLVEYQQLPQTPRQIVERCKGRVYSSDWHLPDDIYNEALRRLEQWLHEECPAPDAPSSDRGRFSAMHITWPVRQGE